MEDFLYIEDITIAFQEVPDELSLCVYVQGCPLNCVGCHSKELNAKKEENKTSLEDFIAVLNKHRGLVSCVTFMGGDWEPSFYNFLLASHKAGFKTCLYTGHPFIENIDLFVRAELDYLKVGPYIAKYGGLRSKNTNQKFCKLCNGQIVEDLTNKFWN